MDSHSLPERRLLHEALDTMTLRGPDDVGVWQDSLVSLGHRRLAIVGVEKGHQPIVSPDGRIVIVVNGEFYGYKELRKTLSSVYCFQTDGDSELLIPLYLRYGYQGMMEHLRGEFAFILYDKEKGIVVAGRDRFGIKPLCWHLADGRLTIASKAKAIHACGVSPEWDEHSLMQALTIQYQPTDRTFFKGIRQLEPGHLLVQAMGCDVQDIPYWDISYPTEVSGARLTKRQEDEYVEQFRDLLTDAIRVRLQGDVPVCCHLSGGLDSSSVAGIMADMLTEPLHCFSIVFPQAESVYDEDRFATETVNRCGAIMHRIEVSQHDILKWLPEAVFHSEGLAVNGHLTCKYLLNKAIHAAGFKVAMTGEGADECLAGYPHLRKDLYALLPAEERRRRTDALYRTNLAITGTEITDGDTLDCSVLTEKLGYTPSFLAAKAGIGCKMYRLLNDDMLHRCRSHDFLAETLTHHHAEQRLKGVHPVNQSLYLWNKHALCNYILSTLGDGCEMSASVEGRLPFLDHRLFEYAAQLPMQMKIWDASIEKYILKEAAHPYITEHVYRRQKHPFQAPPLTRFFTQREFEQIYDELTSDDFCVMRVFKREAVASLLTSLPSMSIVEQTACEPVVMLMLTIHYFNQQLIRQQQRI